MEVEVGWTIVTKNKRGKSPYEPSDKIATHVFIDLDTVSFDDEFDYGNLLDLLKASSNSVMPVRGKTYDVTKIFTVHTRELHHGVVNTVSLEKVEIVNQRRFEARQLLCHVHRKKKDKDPPAPAPALYVKKSKLLEISLMESIYSCGDNKIACLVVSTDRFFKKLVEDLESPTRDLAIMLPTGIHRDDTMFVDVV